MCISRKLLIMVSVGLLLLASQADATVIFQDDFEGYTAASTWPTGSPDRDPGTPPIGGVAWSVNEPTATYCVQVLNIAAGGTSAGPHGGSNYLQTNFMAENNRAAAMISTTNQTLVATNKNLTLDMWVFKNQGTYIGDDRLIGLDAVPGLTTGRAFDLIFKSDGTLDYNDGTQKATGLASPVNTWQHLIVTANFATHTYDVALGAYSVNGLAFADSTISKIQNVYTAGIGAFNTKMSLDDITMTTVVPEPGTLALLVAGVFGLLAYAWRKRK